MLCRDAVPTLPARRSREVLAVSGWRLGEAESDLCLCFAVVHHASMPPGRRKTPLEPEAGADFEDGGDDREGDEGDERESGDED